MRIRKKINCLNENELHDLREAFTGIYELPDSNSNSFTTIAGLHGNPPPSYCIHGSNGFLSWHRAYLLELENALRTIRPNVALPYWDWSSGDTTGLPDACKTSTYMNRDGTTVTNPLYSGPKPATSGGGRTSRRTDIDTTSFDSVATTAQAVIENTVWSNFVSDLNSVHGQVHVTIGGDMMSVSTAGFDPIFYLHHCNIDRLWANWQKLHPMTLPASEAHAVLEPFSRPYSCDWYVGSDFENTLDWDFKYQNWCFIPPAFIDWHLKKVFKLPVEDWIFESRRIAIAASFEMMPKQSYEIQVFINNEEIAIPPKSDKQKGYAGAIGIFGMGNAKMLMRKNQEYKLTLDITSQLRTNAKKNDKEFLITLLPVFNGKQKVDEKELKNLNISLEVD